MDSRLTPARRVQRRLKAGRPAPVTASTPPLYDAIYRAMQEADQAQNILREEGVSAEYLGIKLLIMHEDAAAPQWKLIPKPGQLGPFFTEMEKHESAIFPGLLFAVWEEETGKTLAWVKHFSANPQANAYLLAEAERALKAAPQQTVPRFITDG